MFLCTWLSLSFWQLLPWIRPQTHTTPIQSVSQLKQKRAKPKRCDTALEFSPLDLFPFTGWKAAWVLSIRSVFSPFARFFFFWLDILYKLYNGSNASNEWKYLWKRGKSYSTACIIKTSKLFFVRVLHTHQYKVTIKLVKQTKSLVVYRKSYWLKNQAI